MFGKCPVGEVPRHLHLPMARRTAASRMSRCKAAATKGQVKRAMPLQAVTLATIRTKWRSLRQLLAPHHPYWRHLRFLLNHDTTRLCTSILHRHWRWRAEVFGLSEVTLLYHYTGMHYGWKLAPRQFHVSADVLGLRVGAKAYSTRFQELAFVHQLQLKMARRVMLLIGSDSSRCLVRSADWA